MSIFQKISTLFRSNINDLIVRAENPEKMLNQVILDMRDQLTRAKQEVAAAIADERRLRAQIDEEERLVHVWGDRARLAIRQGRDDMARQALLRAQEHQGRVDSLGPAWQAQSQEIEKLKAALRQLNDRIEEARRKRNLLIAKEKRAQAQKRIQETMSGLSDASAFEAFDRMAEKIEAAERKALAAAEVTEALSGDSLEKEFLAMESGGAQQDIDLRLAGLKQEMGLLPNGRAPRQIGAGQEGGDSRANSIREAELLEAFEQLEAEERDGGMR
jgi:phage shock protein A